MSSKKHTVEFTAHFSNRDGVWRGQVHEYPHVTSEGASLAQARAALDLNLRRALCLVGPFRFRRRTVAMSETWKGSPEVKQ